MKGTSEERLRYLDSLYPIWHPRTLWQLFCERSAQIPGNIFICCDDKEYSYGEIKKRSITLSAGLYSLGVRAGDHVGIAMGNCVEYILLMLAISRLGAVRVGINPRVKQSEFRNAIATTDVSVLLKEENHAADSPGSFVAVCNVGREGERTVVWEELLLAGQGISSNRLQLIEHAPDPQAVSDLIFTSGSTSFPKAVEITGDMLLRSSYATCRMRRMEQGRRIFIPNPLCHIMAYNEGLLPALHVGGAVIITNRRFDAGHALELMKRHRANDVVCITYNMIRLLESGLVHKEDYPSLHALYFAANTPPWAWDRARELFGIDDISTGYGMTECGSTTSVVPSGGGYGAVKYCNGRLKDGGSAGEYGSGRLLEIKIVDLAIGKPAAENQYGMLLCRGCTVTKGYYRNEEATRRAFTADGWFITGDICALDAEGNLRFSGRADDVFKINGENVSPQFLENIIGECSAVRAVECVGITHDRYGSVGVAFVDPVDHSAKTKAEIESYCRSNLAQFQVPRYYFYLGQAEWPRSDSGKVSKAALRKLAESLINDTK